MSREKFLDFGELCLTSIANLLELVNGLRLNALSELGHRGIRCLIVQ